MAHAVNVLGHLTVGVDGVVVTGLAPQQRRLLALLASSPGQSLDREWLAVQLWGSADPAHLRSLQVHISHVRTILGRDRVESIDKGYRLVIEPGEVDEARFRSLIADGQEAVAHARYDDAISHVSEALDLWRGEPYADVTSESFHARRAGLCELRCSAEDALLRARVELIRNVSDAEAVIPLAAHLLADEPYREARVILHMRCLMAAGRLTDAVNAAADFRQRVIRGIGIKPGPDFADAAARIMRRDSALAPAAWQSRVDVPDYPSPLLQRDVEHDLAVSLLKWNSVRVLCLTGAPGVGKTRLAAAVAQTLGHGFPGGVIWLHRERLATPHSAIEYVGALLGIRGGPGELRQTVPVALGRRRTLVVLDGIEGDSAMATVAVLLSAGSAVSIVVTGVQRLGLASEYELHLGSLDEPASSGFVDQLIAAMGGEPTPVDASDLAAAAGAPVALERLAISLVSGGVRA